MARHTLEDDAFTTYRINPLLSNLPLSSATPPPFRQELQEINEMLRVHGVGGISW